MSKINTRSPYFINITTPNITSAVLELYIYTGTQVATMDSITYSLESDAYNGYVSFEVSQLISDYLDITYGGVSTSQVAWVNYQVTETISDVAQTPSAIVKTVAFNGYGYFEDEVNPQLSYKLLQSNDKIVILANQIANTGKKPTVALIKTKLTKSVPLPAIISSLKSWQHDPSFIALPQAEMSNKTDKSDENANCEQLRQNFHEELNQMKQEIAELKQLITELLAQQKI